MISNSSIKTKDENQSLFDCSNDIKPYQCVECPNYRTNFVVHLKRHIRDDHGQEVQNEAFYECAKCNLKTYATFFWLRHNFFSDCALSVKRKKDVQSNLSINQLKSNIRSKLKHKSEETQPFKCQHCCRRFKLSWCLKRHQFLCHSKAENEETKNRPFKCKQCPHETKRKQQLQRHIASFHSKPEGIQWFKCEHCPLKYKQKISLTNHLSVHAKSEDINWFECDRCSYKCQRKAYLKSHVKLRHAKEEDVQLLGCEHCSTKLKRKDSLKTHVRRFHARVEEMK